MKFLWKVSGLTLYDPVSDLGDLGDEVAALYIKREPTEFDSSAWWRVETCKRSGKKKGEANDWPLFQDL